MRVAAVAMAVMLASAGAILASPQPFIDASVLVGRANEGTGSGVLFKNKDRTFVWTDAHVLPDPTIQTIIDPKTGTPKVTIEFDDVPIIEPIVENGRKVGEHSYLAKVVRYSTKHDLALLMVYKKAYGKGTVKFAKEVPKIGSAVWHVGSMSGHAGINSVSDGIFSFAGRIRSEYSHNEKRGIIYDQVSAVAQRGSSGGGVFDKATGECVGLVTEFLGSNTAGSFCITPSRRILAFAKEQKVTFAVDNSVPVPADSEIFSLPQCVDGVEPPKDFKFKMIDILKILR